MFINDILLRGKHAYYTSLLSPRDEIEKRVFNRYIDVYMAGAVIGFIYGRQEEVDRTSEYKDSTASILSQTIHNEREKLIVIFRTIMLLEKGDESSIKSRVDKAFRDDLNRNRNDNHEQNMKLFNRYVHGGISLLHEKIVEHAIDREELILNMNEFIEDFNNDLILDVFAKEEIDYESDII